MNKRAGLLVCGIIIFYLAISFAVITDYGITFDEPDNFTIGHKYLNYYLTGELNFKDDHPEISGHPNFNSRLVGRSPYIYGSFTNILSAVSCYLFYQKLKIFDPITAHHIIIPILTGIFLYCLFRFIQKYWGNFVAVLSVGILITCPRFFGESFNNIKDIPQVIFSSITIMFFADWVISRKLKDFYLAFLFLGIALATKLDAVITIMILTLWSFSYAIKMIYARVSGKAKYFAYICAGVFITFAVFLILLPPLFPGQSGKMLFLNNMLSYWRAIAIDHNVFWNIYAPAQMIYTTPIFILFLFVLGVKCIFTKQALKNKLNVLLIIWVAFPILRHCLPGSRHYDGIRHFLISLVPLAIIAAMGAEKALGRLSKIFKFKQLIVLIVLCIFILLPNMHALIITHPYQTTFFNSFVGGLKGAQERKISSSSDYWLNSYRNAGEWIEKNAKANTLYFAFPKQALFRYYIKRSDLVPIPMLDWQNIPRNAYIIIVPRPFKASRINMDKLLAAVRNLEIVYQLRRQGGEILTIYYKQ